MTPASRLHAAGARDARAATPAEVASGLRTIFRPRTLANSHPVLRALLAPGMSVLDVGCGAGRLTREIARRVAPGRVVGLDVDPAAIRTARALARRSGRAALEFSIGDIRQSRWDAAFDLANASRTLLWIAEPHRAVRRMARAVAPGGRVVIRDAHHVRTHWDDPPPSWTRFFTAFLEWRRARGLDTRIAERLPELCDAVGLDDIRVTAHVITVRAGDPDFFRVAGQWRMLVEGRGREMIAAGHLTERERRAALADYTEWMQQSHASHTAHETSVVARRGGTR